MDAKDATMAKSYTEEQLRSMTAPELERELRHHNHLYWDLATPEISDYEYDRLSRRLKELAPDSPALSEMGPAAVEATGPIGAPVTHDAPMLSLDKCYTDEDLESWATKFSGDIVVTPKMDGIAASLKYDARGRLVLAATRGSGTVGDDITRSALTIAEIPPRLAAARPVEVRGEIYMRLSVFRTFAEQYSNPRNLTAGAIKHKDPERCRAYRLSFFAYNLLGEAQATEVEKLARLVELGFRPSEHLVVDRAGLRRAYEHFAAARAELDFEIDGVVFKADSVAEQDRLGETAHHPRFGLAYKFQGDQATTKLLRIEWNVARTGAITPVAHIEPVELSGAVISRASLHHAGFLSKLGLLGRYPGADVVVTRRGGVIPKVEFVARHVETPVGDEVPIALPEACPSCGGTIAKQDELLFCANPRGCRLAKISAIAHYCAVLEIQGFGDKLLAQAHDEGLLRTPPDLYRLDEKGLLGLERVGPKLAKKLLGEVEAHRRVELAVFLRAIGIGELGKHVATILAEKFGTLERVRRVTAADLEGIHTIGGIIANKAVVGLADRALLIDELLEHVTVLPAEAAAAAAAAGEAAAGDGGAGPEAAGERPLAGKSFVFTGKLLAFERSQAQKRVTALGGSAPDGVTRELTFLVVGDGAEPKKSSKLVKAEKHIAAGAPIRVLTEGEFLEMIGGSTDEGR
jgi:DNA ligase (NAD+)